MDNCEQLWHYCRNNICATQARFRKHWARCLENGMVLGPVVMTAQGALQPGGHKITEVLHRAVAAESGVKLSRARDTFNVRLSIALVRASARATRRRDPDGPSASSRGQAHHVRLATAGLRGAAMLHVPVEDESNDISMDGAAGIEGGLEAEAPMLT